MIKNIKIENFKGIQLLEFNPKSLNIIVGPNNTGKTSILDAISLIFFGMNQYDLNSNCLITKRNKIFNNPEYLIYFGREYAQIHLKIENLIKSNFELRLNIKKFKPEALDDDLFERYNKYLKSLKERVDKDYPDNTISFQERIYEAIRKELQFTLELPNNIKIEALLQKATKKLFSKFLPIKEVDEFFKFFNDSYLNKVKKDLFYDFNVYYKNNLDLISIKPYYRNLVKEAKFSEVFNYIKKKLYYFDDLREIKGEFYVILKNKDGEKYTVPFNIMGDGFKALISLNLLFGQRSNSVFLLEEPETGLHPGYMEIFSEELIKNSKNNQIFITTHSEDLIKYLLEVSEEMGFLDETLLLRLSRNQNIVDREILTKDEIFNELKEIKLDLRGY